MKKILNLMIAFCCVLSCAFVFSGCFAKNEEPTKSYIVQFYNYDGTLVNEISVEENTSAICEIPTKASTQYYVYEFSNWEFLDGTDATEALASVSKTLTVRAKFNEVQPAYTINFYDEDRQTLLDTKIVLRGENSLFATNPTKLDELYSYEFDCWVDVNNNEIDDLNIIQSNLDLYASYNKVGQHSFVVKFYAEDKQTLLKEEIMPEGESVSYVLTKPTSIDGYVYELDCWGDSEDNKISTIEQDINLYPIFGLNVTDTINNLKYLISEDKTYYMLDAGETKTTSSEVKILSDINSIPVEVIAGETFKGCTSLTKIEIPSTITSIAPAAFYGCQIVEVDYLGDVDGWASINFSNESSNPCSISSNTNLKINGQTLIHANITKATEIKNYAFKFCYSLELLTLGSSVTAVGEKAFAYCDNLISVTISSSVKSFGSDAFKQWDETSMEVVNYLGSLDEWMAVDFDSDTSNPLSHGAMLKADGKIITEINTTQDTIIKQYAFMGCSSITSITLSNGNNLGQGVFKYCKFLTTVTITSGVKMLPADLFIGCRQIVDVNYLGDLNSWVLIDFESVASNPLYFGRLKINNEVITSLSITEANQIKPYAFYGYDELTSVTIGGNVTTIGENAFASCGELSSVTIDNSVVTIGSSAFSSCVSLTDVKMGDGVTTIGSYAFSSCVGLTSLPIGENVTTISSYAFNGCTGLTSVAIGEKVKTVSKSAFYECTGITTLTITGDVYIDKRAFYGCTSLTDVTIKCVLGEGPYIADEAFRLCEEITTVTIEDPIIAHDIFYEYSQGYLIKNASTVYIMSWLSVDGSTYLVDNFTKQETSDKTGYDMYVRNAE